MLFFATIGYMKSKVAKQDEKIVHIRLQDTSYKKLAKEAKRLKRSLPNMARYFLESYLEKNIDADFTDKELYKIQSLGRVYSDLEDDDIYNEANIKPIKWD